MRASKNTAFRSGFCALLLRTDESARVYAPAERCSCSLDAGFPKQGHDLMPVPAHIKFVQSREASENLGALRTLEKYCG